MTTKSPFTRPGNTLFVVIFLLFALFLLSQIGGQTRFSPRGQLFAQPRFWPAVGVIGMVGFGAAHLLMNWRQHQSGWATEAFAWLRSLEYLIWFMIYVALVPIIGYLLATVLFTTLLALRAGYLHHGRAMMMAAVMGAGIVVIFKTGLSVKIPGGAIYEYLPTALRNFMIANF